MSKHKLHVSSVLQKAVLEVDELGVVLPEYNGNEPKEFVFNRPFGFLVIDRTTNTLLLVGQMRNPLL